MAVHLKTQEMLGVTLGQKEPCRKANWFTGGCITGSKLWHLKIYITSVYKTNFRLKMLKRIELCHAFVYDISYLKCY